MPKVSILTPTIRLQGLKLVEVALKNQDMQDYEWIVGSKEYPKNIDIPFLWVKDDFEVKVSTLNRIYNRMIERAQAPLIISWQDYTHTKADTLQRFLTHYEHEPRVLVGAVGNKYATVYPEVGAMVWKDPRERSDQGTYYSTGFENIEWNLCSCPKKALFDIGGFDEELDNYYGMDGYSVGERINMLNRYDFTLDQSIKSYSLVHGRPVDWEEKGAIHGPYEIRQQYYSQNGPVLPYLKEVR
jgi:hypothetical protein